MNKMLTAAAALVTGVSALLPAGCAGSTSPSPGSGMMGGAGAPMGYQYSKSTCAVPASLPGHTVTVVLGDMNMTQMMGGTAALSEHMMLLATPTTVTAGQISLVAENMGWRTHELVILPLASGTSAGRRVPAADGKVDETGSLGEASASCAAGTGQGITAGSIGWTTVTLPAGRYELVCDLPNHYADGMRQELDVTAG